MDLLSHKSAMANDIGDAEALCYLAFSPNWAAAHRIYTDEDIYASGGIHAIEQILEMETYWFVRLGTIRGDVESHALTFQESDIAELPLPAETIWKTGRRNPAFAGSELERRAFRAMYRAIERMLDAWKIEENQTVDAYALKELKINPDVLRSVTNGLQTIRRVHEIVEITVIKYWYDLSWPGPHLPSDLVLGEYSLRIPVEIMWSASERLINVEVMNMCLC